MMMMMIVSDGDRYLFLGQQGLWMRVVSSVTRGRGRIWAASWLINSLNDSHVWKLLTWLCGQGNNCCPCCVGVTVYDDDDEIVNSVSGNDSLLRTVLTLCGSRESRRASIAGIGNFGNILENLLSI